MKDSGIAWIGSIPSNWNRVCISYITTSRSGGTPNRDNPLYWENGTIPWMSSGEVNKSIVWDTNEKITPLGSEHSSAKILPKNSVMVALNGQGKTKGMVAVLKIPAACNQSLCAIQCNDNLLYYQYLYYCFKAMYKYLRSQAGDDIRDGLSASFVVKQNIPFPDRSIQQRIADFLDVKCTEIDSIIDKTRSSIEEYKKVKQSIIFQSITKGIRGKRPLKSTGIEWIGEIPKDWTICTIGSIAAKEKYSITDGPFGSDMKSEDYVSEGVPIIQLNNITPNLHRLNSIKFVSQEKANELKRHSIFPGDIVMAKMMPSGKAAIVCDAFEKYIISADCIRIKVNENNNTKFICYCINSLAAIEASISSFGATRARINLGDAKKLKLVCPNIEEQQEIASYLDLRCSEIDSIVSSKEKFITELESYKSSLIYEYVTGKKEVPSTI